MAIMTYYTGERPSWVATTYLPGSAAIVFSNGVYSDLFIGSFIANSYSINGTLNSVESYNGNVLINKITNLTANANIIGTAAFYNIALGGNDTIYGSYQDDPSLVGLGGNDIIYGLDGNDILRGGLGDDYLDGGSGVNWVDHFGTTGPVEVNLSTARSVGSDGNDTLVNIQNIFGGGFNDVLTGDASNNIFQGGAGNDVIDGKAGEDKAEFKSSFSASTITRNSNGTISISSLLDGTDTLTDVEFAIFSDRTVSLSDSTPTYALVASSASVNEGSNATFTLSTTNVAAGTQVAYTLSGVSAADVQGGVLTGTATVGANGQATISVALLADSLTEGAETLTVTAGGKTASTTVNDTSVGSSTVQPGTSGNDTFRITSGSNSVDGGAGSDIVQYQTTRSAASVTLNNGTITVSKANGTDTITGVERIDFTDGDLVFDVTSANAPAAYRLYGGAFARTPDEGGFRFWASTLDKNVSLRDVATQFINSDEFIGRYGASLGNAAFVDALYQNVLSRGGDAGGVAHWNRMLDNKFQDRSDILVQFTQLPEFVGISAANTTNGYWVV